MKHYLPLIGRAVSAGLSVAALLFSTLPAPAQQAPDVAALNAKLPKSIRDRGVLMVGNSASVSPPWSYHPDNDSEKFAGFDVDLATEIARRLGLKVKFESLPFAGLIPGIAAGRFDMGMQGMDDNPARQKVVDMVDYMFSGDGIVVQAGNPKNIDALADLCGKKAAALLGSAQLALLQGQSEKCGKPIEIMQFPQIADAYVALQSGRADAYVYGYTVSSYLEKVNSPQFKGLKLVPTMLNVSVKAIAVQKGLPELRDLIKTIIGDMIAEGSYQKMADKWGLGDSTVKAPDINNHLMKP